MAPNQRSPDADFRRRCGKGDTTIQSIQPTGGRPRDSHFSVARACGLVRRLKGYRLER